MIHTRLSKAGLALSCFCMSFAVSEFTEIWVSIVIVTVASAEDGIYTSLDILYVCIGIKMSGIGIG